MNSTSGPQYNSSVESVVKEEYPSLNGVVYLDHAGTTPYSKSLMDSFARDMITNLYGNPHSASTSSQLSTTRVENTRLRVLQWFNASPADFDVVFVANATAAVKLVIEALRATPGGFDYAYHLACHTSLVGVREEASSSFCFTDPATIPAKSAEQAASSGVTLVAYPAQSNMDGQRLPLTWSADLRQQWKWTTNGVYTLLDAAALVATSPLDLSDSESAPDFTVLSFYKIFGFPDLGALIVRRQAESVFDRRKYFGGGTVDMVVCQREQWHAPKSQFLHERLEDGTLPVHSIIALGLAMDEYNRLFGSIGQVSRHTAYLRNRLCHGLRALRHANGTNVCTIYSQNTDSYSESIGIGPVIAFNLRNGLGAWVSLAEFEKLATLKHFHVRTGGVCNPGGIASALGLEPWEIRKNFSSGFRCGTEDDIIGGKPTGAIRVSLGAMSTLSDVDMFVAFIKEFYVDENVLEPATQPIFSARKTPDLYVQSITIYPIKSCGGYDVPGEMRWEVRPEGLAWDREWCLLHRGTGQALSQKKYPKMALIRPSLDFGAGHLRVTFSGEMPAPLSKTITIPLSNNPALFAPITSIRSVASRVCGEEILAQTYASEEINAFFSGILDVPCVLARFPAGGQGKSMRHSKAHLQKHQMLAWERQMNSHSPPPSPPDSDVENARQRILLSNESPILVINSGSVAALNREIVSRGGREISPAVFRANVVVGPASNGQPYAEDSWTTLRIGHQCFRMLGSCRRCHMVCINQENAEKSEEPFVTLSKTRRFDGKVFFGTHMSHTRCLDTSKGKDAQFATIQVGDVARPDAV